MKIIFDQGTPVPLRKSLSGHQVDTAFELGWSTLKNGDLLNKAEESGYSIFITTDQNLRFQQNLGDRRISIIVLNSTSWPKISRKIDLIAEAVLNAQQNSFEEIHV